jgi:hypothetical protein
MLLLIASSCDFSQQASVSVENRSGIELTVYFDGSVVGQVPTGATRGFEVAEEVNAVRLASRDATWETVLVNLDDPDDVDLFISVSRKPEAQTTAAD